MSEILIFSSTEIKGWLENKTSPILVPFQTKAKKIRDEMSRALENLADASKMLLENSKKEIEEGNMKPYGRARALNKLARLFLERIKQIEVPNKVSCNILLEFSREIQETFIVTEIDIQNWFPRISPFFASDREEFLTFFGKAKESFKEMNNLTTKECVKIKMLEDTFQLIDELNALEEQLKNLSKQKEKYADEKALSEKTVYEAEQRMAELKSKGGINQLDQIETKIEALSTEIKQSLNHLQKPFIKLHAEVSSLTPEEFNKLNQYLENPFQALATEDADYPILKRILQKMSRLMSNGKLKLKLDKERKAKQAIDNIISTNSLAGLQQKSINVITQKEQLSTAEKFMETKNILSSLQENIEKIKRRMDSVEIEKKMTEKVYDETLEKTRNHKKQIEKNILVSMNKMIHIE